jgi:hypothetical protein
MMAIKPGDVLINQMQEPTPPITHAQKIASQLKLPIPKVAATIDLLTAGNTLPFIARYRKEATGGLDEEQNRRDHGGAGHAPGAGRAPRHRAGRHRRAGQADA